MIMQSIANDSSIQLIDEIMYMNTENNRYSTIQKPQKCFYRNGGSFY